MLPEVGSAYTEMTAEVMRCVKSEAHKVSVFKTLWRSACSSRLLTCDYNTTSSWTNLHTRAYSRGARDASDAPHSSTTAYYDILKVSPHATQAQIKTAYYKQAFMYHPDRNRGEEAARRFALIAEAYSVLGSVALRKRYDSGALTLADAQDACRPSSSHQRQGSRCASNASTNACFDFDAHYQAHYGSQLQRERKMKDKREEMKQHQRQDFTRWKARKVTEATAAFLLLSAAVLLISLRAS